MSNAPVALFVYKRPGHTRRALESLLSNPGSRSTPLYVFCDGARSDEDAAGVARTRATVCSLAPANAHVIEHKANLGLARSVTAGVTQVCSEHGAVIVLEDDLVLAPTFLAFMNTALELYRDEERVYGVSGYMFPVDLADLRIDALFLPLTCSWGWATWERAWRNFVPGDGSLVRLRSDETLRKRFDVGGYPYFAMLEAQNDGTIDSWAIRWYATAFLHEGLTLYPARSLVTNAGFDGTGVHSGSSIRPLANGRASAFRAQHFPSVSVHQEALRRVANKLADTRRPTPLQTAALTLLRLARAFRERVGGRSS